MRGPGRIVLSSVGLCNPLPRMIASKHYGLHQAGMRLQKQWKSKVYRKEVEVFWQEQETIRVSQTTIIQSVQMHQARIIQHSYRDLCHRLDQREGMVLSGRHKNMIIMARLKSLEIKIIKKKYSHD